MKKLIKNGFFIIQIYHISSSNDPNKSYVTLSAYFFMYIINLMVNCMVNLTTALVNLVIVLANLTRQDSWQQAIYG